jgi:hypothetical protein
MYFFSHDLLFRKRQPTIQQIREKSCIEEEPRKSKYFNKYSLQSDQQETKSRVCNDLNTLLFSAKYLNLRKTVTNVVVIVIESEEAYVVIFFWRKGSECKR